jgi:predicted phosphoadenosine phosphosulfate sulfurtransferase
MAPLAADGSDPGSEGWGAHNIGRYWAPSWRRLCKVLLRNDWWCKGLGMTQPKSEAYQKYMQIKAAKKAEAAA